MIKAIFFDIDGTLVDPATGRISEKTRETLTRLHENGILLCIATGRPPASLPNLEGLHFDAFCTFNGSLCYTKAEIIHSTPLPPEAARQVLKNATALGRPVSVALKDRLAANGFDEDLEGYYRLAGVEPSVDAHFDRVFDEEIYQIMLGSREAEYAAILRDTEGLKLAVSWERAADVIPLAGGQEVAIGRILSHFHLKPEAAMAFGDGRNDIGMLRTVGIGVAMGNGAEALKAVAKDVCGQVSGEGIYHYCLDHGLI